MIVVHYVPNANLAVKWHDERCEDCGVHDVRGGNVVCNHCWDKTHQLSGQIENIASLRAVPRSDVTLVRTAVPERKCLACGAVLVPKPYEIRSRHGEFERRITCGSACRGILQTMRTKERGGSVR